MGLFFKHQAEILEVINAINGTENPVGNGGSIDQIETKQNERIRKKNREKNGKKMNKCQGIMSNK